MVHFDAHPDMSVPTYADTSQWACRDFIEVIMSNPGGISEFLLPLLYTRRMNRVCHRQFDLLISVSARATMTPDLLGEATVE